MNDAVKGALLFTAGGVVGFVVTKLVLTKRYEDRLEEDIASIREAYAYRAKNEPEEPEEPEEVPVEAETPDVETMAKNHTVSPIPPEAREAIDRYTELAGQYDQIRKAKTVKTMNDPYTQSLEIVTDDGNKVIIPEIELVDMDPVELDQLIYGKTRQGTHDSPYMITREEMEEEELAYLKTTMTFYEGDSALVDDDDTVIENPEFMVGKVTLDVLKVATTEAEPNTLFVRNDRLQTDFEILITHESYSKDVLGWK